MNAPKNPHGLNNGLSIERAPLKDRIPFPPFEIRDRQTGMLNRS